MRFGTLKGRRWEYQCGSYLEEECRSSRSERVLTFSRDRVPVYGWVGGDTPHDVLSAAQERKAQGFTVVKMNATGQLGWLDSPAKLDAVVERVKQVKSVGIDVGLDFHGRVHKAMAKQLLRKLESVEPFFVEEPILPGLTDEMVKLYNMTSIPIATGERLYTRQDCRPYFEKVNSIKGHR